MEQENSTETKCYNLALSPLFLPIQENKTDKKVKEKKNKRDDGIFSFLGP